VAVGAIIDVLAKRLGDASAYTWVFLGGGVLAIGFFPFIRYMFRLLGDDVKSYG